MSSKSKDPSIRQEDWNSGAIQAYKNELIHTKAAAAAAFNISFWSLSIAVLAIWLENMLRYNIEFAKDYCIRRIVTAILAFGMLTVAESSGLVVMWSHTPTDGYISRIILDPYSIPSWSFHVTTEWNGCRLVGSHQRDKNHPSSNGYWIWTNMVYHQHMLVCTEWQTYFCQITKLLIQSVTDGYPSLLDDRRTSIQI